MDKRANRRRSAIDRAKISASKKATTLRHASMSIKCYELKIVEKRLNNKQRNELFMMFLEGKRFYNNILADKESRDVYLSDINPSSYYSVKCRTKDKTEVTYSLEYLPSACKQTIHARMIANEKTIIQLVKRGFQEHGKLHFISDLSCIPIKSGHWHRKSYNKFQIMGVSGRVLMRGADQIPNECEFANANLIKRADGYYFKITCYISKDKERKQKNGKEIGLDFGIKTAITTSEGKKFDATVEESDHLKKLQKEMFRRKKGSKNRRKTIRLINKAYQKLDNKKQDMANRIYHELRQYSRIYMQDENLQGWKASGFGKKVQHSILGRVKAKLINLPQTVVLDRFIPTTKLCPECGSILNTLTLEDRTYVCPCGYQEDRDVHASKNMITIAKACFEDNLVPPEQREITLMEFQSSTYGVSNDNTSKLERRSEKITPFKV